MTLSKPAPLLLATAGAATLLAASGCYDPYYVGGTVGYRDPHVSTVVSVNQPWYDYYYYPAVGVYFNYRTGYYYYSHRGRWRHARHLPSHIHIRDYDRVHLRMRDDKPYRKYNEHRVKYKNYGKHKVRDRDHYRHKEKRYDGGKGSHKGARSSGKGARRYDGKGRGGR
jgi:hypothetical protein